MPLARVRCHPLRGVFHLTAVLVFALPAATAFASAQRTFVSPNGADANTASNCSLLLPCRSFGAAITVTNTGGEIIVLDSAGYGPVVITKSVSIISPPGIYAGVSVLAGDGITMNTAGINVLLKGLTVNGQGGNYGIRFTQGSRLDIEGCTVANMVQDGILIEGPGTVSIASTSALGNGGVGIHVNAAAVVTISETTVEASTATGIRIANGASATIDHTTVVKNGNRGISVHGVVAGTRAAINASTVTDHALGAGIYVETTSASLVAHLDVAGTTIARNTNGIELNSAGGGTVTAGIVSNQIVENPGSGILASGLGSTARASWNGIFRNVNGFNAAGGAQIFSPATNYVRDNASNGAPSSDTLL